MMMPSTPCVTAASTSRALLGGLVLAVGLDQRDAADLGGVVGLSAFCMCTKNGNPRSGSDVAIVESCAWAPVAKAASASGAASPKADLSSA